MAINSEFFNASAPFSTSRSRGRSLAGMSLMSNPDSMAQMFNSKPQGGEAKSAEVTGHKEARKVTKMVGSGPKKRSCRGDEEEGLAVSTSSGPGRAALSQRAEAWWFEWVKEFLGCVCLCPFAAR
jgi:hypothetical protein